MGQNRQARSVGVALNLSVLPHVSRDAGVGRSRSQPLKENGMTTYVEG